MKTKRLCIYCAGGLGLEILQLAKIINEKNKEWEYICFIDDAPELEGQKINGVEVLSFERYLESAVKETDRFIIAAGESVTRKAIDRKLQEHGLFLDCLIHPDNHVADTADLGPGTIVQNNVNPPPNCKVGRCVLLQGNSAIGHEVEVGDYSTISTFSFVGGETSIGEECYIAPGAMLRNKIKIGKNCIVGMGSIVTKDVPDNSVVYGNPGRVVRENTSGKVFSK